MGVWCQSVFAPVIYPVLDENNNPEWKTLAFDEHSGQITVPRGAIGFRWGEKANGILKKKTARERNKLRLSLQDF